MIGLIAIGAICLVLFAVLNGTARVRVSGPGPYSWRGGRRQITEEEAVRLVRDRLGDDDDG